jgi:uncharacterized membrane protein
MKPETQPVPPGTEISGPATALLPSPWAHVIHKPLFIAFLLCFAFGWTTLVLGASPDWPWIDPLLWTLAAAASMVGLSRRLPEQNVLMSAAIIAGLSLGIAVVGDRTAIPYGPRVYSDHLGGWILGVPWPVPLMWIAIMVTGRGVARLIMRPWRKTTYYGFWVIGLTCLLALWLDIGLEPFAARVKRYWLWQASPDVWHWHSAPWTNFLGWFVTAVSILGFTTPWLINKQPVKQPTDYHPLVVWLLLNFYFATGNALHQMGSAAGLSLAGCAIATVYAVRGARW